jgi:hypothetical protein
MSNRFMSLAATAGAAVLAVVLTGAIAVRADSQSATSQPVPQAETLAQMQARMQAMQAQMAQMQTASDPAERQKLLAAHMQLMQAQMASMRSMGGGMMQMMHGGAATGMGSGMPGMSGGMAQGGMQMQQGANAGARSPGPRHQMVEDRLDMLQMMMEQMMGQMQMQMQPGPHGPGR